MLTRNQEKKVEKQNAFTQKNITPISSNTKIDQLMNMMRSLTIRINIIKVKFRFITLISFASSASPASPAPPASQSQ